MVGLKEKLLETRKGSTANKLLGRLSTVMNWAVNNGYLDKTFDKGLKLTKGADSSHVAFTPAQIEAVMPQVHSLPADSWHRWGFSLGAITGARIGEIYQLTKDDVKQVNNVWVSLNCFEYLPMKNTPEIGWVSNFWGAVQTANSGSNQKESQRYGYDQHD
jgi:integrase